MTAGGGSPESAPRTDARPARASGWLEVRVTPAAGGRAGPPAATAPQDAKTRAQVVDLLVAYGSSAVIEEGAAFLGFVPAHVDTATLRSALGAVDAGADVEIVPAADVDWTKRWRDGVHAHAVGRLTVAPPWLAAGTDPSATVIIDPGMAFGTGEHPTTRGVIRLACRVVRAGDTVADLGAGSAVLAIAAAKLGATRVAAVEIDHEAIADAEANVRRNGVADRVHVVDGDAASLLPLLAPVRVVLANIISSVLVELLPAMAGALAPDGRAILSGILVEERAAMSEVLDASGWRIEDEDIEGTWWSATIARR